jgi:hypothetical protein
VSLAIDGDGAVSRNGRYLGQLPDGPISFSVRPGMRMEVKRAGVRWERHFGEWWRRPMLRLVAVKRKPPGQQPEPREN